MDVFLYLPVIYPHPASFAVEEVDILVIVAAVDYSHGCKVAKVELHYVVAQSGGDLELRNAHLFRDEDFFVIYASLAHLLQLENRVLLVEVALKVEQPPNRLFELVLIRHWLLHLLAQTVDCQVVLLPVIEHEITGIAQVDADPAVA